MYVIIIACIIFFLSVGRHCPKIPDPGAQILHIFDCVRPSSDSDIVSMDSESSDGYIFVKKIQKKHQKVNLLLFIIRC